MRFILLEFDRIAKRPNAEEVARTINPMVFVNIKFTRRINKIIRIVRNL